MQIGGASATSTGSRTRSRFGGRLVAVRDSQTGLHSLHQDHLSSTTLQTSASGAVEGAQFRGPFGQPWFSSGALATDFQDTGQRSIESGVAGAAGGLGSLVDYGSRWCLPPCGLVGECMVFHGTMAVM